MGTPAQNGDAMGSIQNLKTCSELRAICLQTLRACRGFEMVEEIVVRSKHDDGTVSDGTANWIVAAIRPRVDNQSLRGAQETIRHLQAHYQMADKS
jgi:hypothetical protein